MWWEFLLFIFGFLGGHVVSQWLSFKYTLFLWANRALMMYLDFHFKQIKKYFRHLLQYIKQKTGRDAKFHSTSHVQSHLPTHVKPKHESSSDQISNLFLNFQQLLENLGGLPSIDRSMFTTSDQTHNSINILPRFVNDQHFKTDSAKDVIINTDFNPRNLPTDPATTTTTTNTNTTMNEHINGTESNDDINLNIMECGGQLPMVHKSNLSPLKKRLPLKKPCPYLEAE